MWRRDCLISENLAYKHAVVSQTVHVLKSNRNSYTCSLTHSDRKRTHQSGKDLALNFQKFQ